jgi:PAS domain S-box-containing protein
VTAKLQVERDPVPQGGSSRTGTADIPNRDVPPPPPTQVLLVEDDPAHAELARRGFDSRPGSFSVTAVDTVEAARRVLDAAVPPDVVIADWRLPDGEGVDLLRSDPAGGLPPIVIMTSQGSERVAVEVMRAGAVDYVVKSEATLADLAHVAERALRQRRIEEAVGDIAAGTRGAGEAFFQSKVLRLARVLRVKYASVAELLPGGRLRTLARCIDGALADNVEYALEGTPCARVLDGSVCYFRDGVTTTFPDDEALRRLRAESYVGAALTGSNGTPLGLVNAIHERPLDEVMRPEVVVRVFASRAAAELERRRAAAELERQRRFAESLLDMVASLVIVVDVEGRIVRFNRACETASGWTEAEVRGREFWEVLRPPEDREDSGRYFNGQIDAEKLPPAYEATWLTRGGDRRLISWVVRPISDGTGRVSSVIGTGLDITDSRRTEEALRESEARYRTLMQNAPEAIVVADLDEGRLVDANDNAEALFELDREALLQTDPAVLLPGWPLGKESSDSGARNVLEQAAEGETPVSEIVHVSASGSERPCEMRLVMLPGPRDLVRISLIDIGERKRLEADLRQAALEWRRTFDGLPLGVVVVDGEGRVVRANRTAVVQSGRSSWSDLISTPLTEIGPGEIWAALGELVKAMRAGARPAPREVRDSSTGRTWVVSASSLPTDEDGPGRAVLNFQDVSETVDLKERLRQSETMAAIGSVVAGVAHEVRNPLFSISATLDAFASRYGETESYGKYLSVLRGEIGRLTTLMKDLLEFGRPSEPELGRWKLTELVHGAIETCRPLLDEKGVEITRTGNDDVPPVLADRMRMTQVLQNLIENAIHYSPPGGRVDVSLGPGGNVRESWGEFVECAVHDSGPGFAPADLDQLFEPFFTRRRGGTGLGLSIVKRIVYDHGGKVFARNHPAGGAVVAVWLRRAEP